MVNIDPEIDAIIKKAYPYIKEFNPAQQAVIDSGYLESEDNYIISIPTASGKTVLGVLAALKVLQKGGKIIYAVPLKSLQNEKYKEFKRFEEFGYKVGKSPKTSDIAVMVFESFDVLTRSANQISEVDLVIIDEFHMIGDYSRGPTLECAITRVMDKNTSIRLIALSATLRNMDELASWLNAEVVTHDYRPVPLHKEVLCTEEFDTKDKNNIVYKILNDSLNESAQMLTFVATRRFTEALAKNMAKKIEKKLPDERREVYAAIAEDILDVSRRGGNQPTELCYTLAECIKCGVAFHHAGLFDRQKEIIEDEFINGNLLMITATPSLMYGVNLPSKNVIIRDYTWWNEQGSCNIPVFDFEQMAGRAGRPGFDTEGNAYLIAKSYDEAFYLNDFYIEGEIELTHSKLIDNHDAVLRQIITQVSTGNAHNVDELIEFFSKTLYGYQIQNSCGDMGYAIENSIKIEIESSLQYLIEHQIIRPTPSGLQTTPFGVLISRNNYSVKTAVRLRGVIEKMDEFKEAELIYEVASSVEIPKVNTKYRANKDNIRDVLGRNGIFIYNVTPDDSTAASLLEWINEKKEYEIENYLKVYAASTSRSSYEASSLVKFVGKICDVIGIYEYHNEIETLAARLYYGIKPELIPVVIGIKHLGRQRARKIFDIFRSDLSNVKKEQLMKIDGIGESIATNIVNYYQK